MNQRAGRAFKIKVFSDGADASEMVRAYKAKEVDGFTTNPTLMRKGGVADYEAFAKKVLSDIKDLPISFEVFSDDFAEMERQALKIRSWGANVYVKIPVTNTRGESAAPLIARLAKAGVPLNVTALLTVAQVRAVAGALDAAVPAVVSVFAGRIADTGRDPVPAMKEALEVLAPLPKAELLWASPRELLNIFQAEAAGCHIITVAPDILKKLALVGKDLAELSLDTVKMFRDDAVKAGYSL